MDRGGGGSACTYGLRHPELVEQLVEEALLAALVRALAVAAPVVVVVIVVAVAEGVGEPRPPLALVLVVASARRRMAALPALLGVDQALQLAPVQEDAAALGALVDGDAAALVGAHAALALGADEVGRGGHRWKPPCRAGRSGAGFSRRPPRTAGSPRAGGWWGAA